MYNIIAWRDIFFENRINIPNKKKWVPMPSEKYDMDVPKPEKVRKKIPKLIRIAQGRILFAKMVHIPKKIIPLAIL